MLLFVVSFVSTIVLPKATAVASRGESPDKMLRQAALLSAAISEQDWHFRAHAQARHTAIGRA